MAYQNRKPSVNREAEDNKGLSQRSAGMEGNCRRGEPSDEKIAIQYKQLFGPKAAVGCFSCWCFSSNKKTHTSARTVKCRLATAGNHKG